jgi:hypothetical protein
MGQASGIVGQGALTFARNLNGSAQFFVLEGEIGHSLACLLNDGFTFFSLL